MAIVVDAGEDPVTYGEVEAVLLDVAKALDKVAPALAAKDTALLAASLAEADRALGRLSVVEGPDQG